MSEAYQTSFLAPPVEPEPLINTRTWNGEARHIALMRKWPGTGTKNRTEALCGAGGQENCGAGTFRSILQWATCHDCKGKAERMGPHPSQDGNIRPDLRRAAHLEGLRQPAEVAERWTA